MKPGGVNGFTPRFMDPDGPRLQVSARVIRSPNDLNPPISCGIDSGQNSANQGRCSGVGKLTPSLRHRVILGIPLTGGAGGFAARLL